MFFCYKRLLSATNGYGHCYRFSASQPKNGNVVDAERPASAPIADAGKTAPAPGAGAVAVFLGAGCRSLPMPRFGTVSGNGIWHRWKRANPSLIVKDVEGGKPLGFPVEELDSRRNIRTMIEVGRHLAQVPYLPLLAHVARRTVEAGF